MRSQAVSLGARSAFSGILLWSLHGCCDLFNRLNIPLLVVPMVIDVHRGHL
jgi:hypothetical protein